MSNLRAPLLALCLFFVPTLGQAHPHVFIDASLRAVVDADGMFKGLEVQWAYDDFYSLLIFADLELDSDGDGRLRPDEVKRLEGFDLQWVDGYEGDSYASLNGRPVALGAPQSRGTRVEGGRIITTHFRPANAPAAGLQIKAYDPTFYTAYELAGQVEVDGPCTARIEAADLDAAYTKLEELLYATPESEATDYYPEVGESFADTVMLSCAP
ncbi:DUF1007 family protein [uncultured Tateyamaria sp.]|uniref:DUF1007 family protein n=1 Tax=uncultured Tateyamaria sp. TaxID=455651 RepID=UPI00260742FF|nr:DUF1007 family protein [uncultured Tateyamaria sp.]